MTGNASTLRIGTRGSDLALWQARHVAALLAGAGIEARIGIISTRGDREQRAPFAALGGKGIFVKEIEEALLAGTIDLAVHSLKDLPTSLPEGLALAAVPRRAAPFDALVAREPGMTLQTLPGGARLATSSLRRAAQALAARPDLQIVPMRGNVPTRVEKIRGGAADATLLAVAGLGRLGLEAAISQTLPPEIMTPPMGQGALGIEARAGEFAEIFARLEDCATRRAVTLERAFLAALGGGCSTPAGVLAWPLAAEAGAGGNWRAHGALASPDGREVVRREARLTLPAADVGGDAAAREICAAAGRRLAREIFEAASPELRALTAPAPGAAEGREA